MKGSTTFHTARVFCAISTIFAILFALNPTTDRPYARGEVTKPSEVAFTAKVLSLGTNMLSYSFELGGVVSGDGLTAWGTTIETEYQKGVLKYTVGAQKATTRKLPVVVRFAAGKQERAVCFFDSGDGQLRWAPHFGAEFRFEGELIRLIDVNMNGDPTEVGIDAFAGPNSAIAQIIRDELWLPNCGYLVSYADKNGGFVAKLTQLSFPRDSNDYDFNSAWAYFNYSRQMVGFRSVEWDETMASHCLAHAEYCRKTGQMTHFQDPKSPEYTPEGYKGGISSNLGFAHDKYFASMVEQFRTVYHTANMIQPGQRKSGMALAGKCFAVDVRSGVSYSTKRYGDIDFVWPPHGASEVFCSFNPNGENPMPVFGMTTAFSMKLGQCVFAKINGTGKFDLILRDEKGKKVPCHLTHPERSASLYGGNDNLVSAAPHAPLAKFSTYTAVLNFTGSDGQPVVHTWQFTTGGGF